MILDEIVNHKRKEIEILKKKRKSEGFQKPLRDKRGKFLFYEALSSAADIAVIAEIKRRSPSRGVLRKDFNPVVLARDLEAGGAAALSVLTDKKFFGGSLEILKKVRGATRLPILRKDFILDECQIYEAAAAGADAVLLIAAILTGEELADLSELASTLGLSVLFEAHDKRDMSKILPLKPSIVGINNRDLKTFRVDLKTTEELAGMLPEETLLVSESGILTRGDIDRLKRSGARAILVGESLMRTKNVTEGLRDLLRG